MRHLNQGKPTLGPSSCATKSADLMITDIMFTRSVFDCQRLHK